MDGLVHDIRYAFRLLTRAPAFALAAILTLALGIGANVAVFSVVYGVLLRPLPFRDADRLILAHADVDYVGAHRPVPVFVQPNQRHFWQRRFDAIGTLALFSMEVQALSGGAGSEVIDSAIVSDEFFSMLAGPMRAGRRLEPADDMAPSAVISERLARRLFGDPAGAVGRQLTLSSRVYTIVGVAGAAFQFPDARRDVWLPSSSIHVESVLRFQHCRAAESAPLERARGGRSLERTSLAARSNQKKIGRGRPPAGQRPSRQPASAGTASAARWTEHDRRDDARRHRRRRRQHKPRLAGGRLGLRPFAQQPWVTPPYWAATGDHRVAVAAARHRNWRRGTVVGAIAPSIWWR